MKNLQTFEEFINESETNEGLSGLLLMATLSGLFSIGQWAYKSVKYWTSKPGRYFKSIENDREFYIQFIELLSKYDEDLLKAIDTINDLRRTRNIFIDEFFELPRAVELRNKIGLDESDMFQVRLDFENALIKRAVYNFIKQKLGK